MASDPPFHFIAVYIVDMNIAECEIYKTRREKKGSEIRSVYVYIRICRTPTGENSNFSRAKLSRDAVCSATYSSAAVVASTAARQWNIHAQEYSGQALLPRRTGN